ncbi:MAG: bifunctional 5,10-methylenetetrahydrofolate dehydrogenase/5,10-methenyltetrahydrofolate cyclohydrolase [Lachnospiraceae bacterium]|nr:bifunctional 5,10-methylenetetrahydrofolate dehydrogenase/5,10-methenyltetrahydrofolate cyclohydrolase [Lachnospiraceae bacterium]
MAKLLLGKAVNEAINHRVSQKVDFLKRQGIAPRLAIVRCGDNPSDVAYEKGAVKKAGVVGIETQRIVLPESISKADLISQLHSLNQDESVDGVLLLRPLPKHLRADEGEIVNALDYRKDVDCMTDLSNAGVYLGKEIGFPPCTPSAVMEILDYYGIDVKGKNITVIGRSLVVGKPVAMMLMARHATVTICHTRTVDVAAIARRADIIVSAAGALGSLGADFVREGQIIIDVSVNWDPGKRDGQGGMAGDAVFEEIEPIVEAITPVPGGVGAVTTSVLMEHVVKAAEGK